MVEEVSAQREVSGLNRVGRVAMKFTRKISEMGGRWPVGAYIDKKNSIFWVKIPIFFRVFFGFNFAECRHSAKALSSARQKTLGKDAFAECSLPSANWALPSAH